MKVLWFTGVMPVEFSRALNQEQSVIQGWVPSLVEAIRCYAPNIKLTVACEGGCEAKASVNGVDYIALGHSNKKGRKSFANKVQKCVLEVNPDLIHLHGSENIYPSLPEETWCEKPVAMSLQGIINGIYPQAMGGLIPSEVAPFIGVVRKLGLGGSIYDHAEYWRSSIAPYERVAFRNVKYVFGRTEWDRAWTKYLNSNSHYAVVGELMRDPFYSGKRDAHFIKRHSIYCSAALGSPLKGGHWLIRAVASLKQKYPDVQLRVAGGSGCDKPRSLYGRLRQPQYGRYIWNLIEQLGVKENVVLLPNLKPNDVLSELRQAEVFCLPSLAENSSNSLGEAMLLGVPSVVTDVGGNSSLLRNGEEGLVVPSCDPAVLADAIDRLFSNPVYAQRLGHQGYESAIKRYDKATVVKQLCNAYSLMLCNDAS